MGVAIDVVVLLLVIASWDLPVIELATGLVSGGEEAVRGVRSPVRGFSLVGVEGELIGLGFTGLVLAMQIPFLARGSTLGLGLCGLELRTASGRAGMGVSIPWALLTWLLSLVGVYGLGMLWVAGAVDGGSTVLAVAALGMLTVSGVNGLAGLLSGRSVLDTLLGVLTAPRSAPTPAPGDHLGGWQPRPGFKPWWTSSTVDDEAKLWRQAVSPDPLAPIWGTTVAPIPESPEEPAHVEHMSADDPFAAVGGHADTDEEAQALIRRLTKEP